MIRCVPDHFAFFKALIMPFKSLRSSIDLFERKRPRFVASQSVDYRSGGKRQCRLLHTKLPRTQLQGQKMDANNRMPRFCACTSRMCSMPITSSSGRFGGPARTTPCRFPSVHANGFEILHHHFTAFLFAHFGKHSSRLRCTIFARRFIKRKPVFLIHNRGGR